MKLPGWFVRLAWTMVCSLVLAAFGFWWFVEPVRTAEAFLEALRQGERTEARSIADPRDREVRWLLEFSDEVLSDWFAETKLPNRALVDIVCGRQTFELKHGQMTRGFVAIGRSVFSNPPDIEPYVTATWRIADIVESQDDKEALVELIQVTIEPRTWDVVGGDGQVSVEGPTLRVTHEYAIHEKVRQLLSRIGIEGLDAVRAKDLAQYRVRYRGADRCGTVSLLQAQKR